MRRVGLGMLGLVLCGAVSCRGCACTEPVTEAAPLLDLSPAGDATAARVVSDEEATAVAAVDDVGTEGVAAPTEDAGAPHEATTAPAAVVNASRGGSLAPGETPAPAVATVGRSGLTAPAPEAVPRAFAWHQPPDDAVTLFAQLLLRGEAPAGTRIKIEGGRSVAVSGDFAIPLTLRREGRQQIVLSVTTPGGRERHARTVTYLDVGLVDRFQAQISGQRVAVGDLERVRADLLETVTAIRGILPTVSPSARGELQPILDELQAELDGLGALRADLDGDIEKELDAVERLRQAAGVTPPQPN